ncbi:MAG TPA: GWxTD domain-containing protein, partial [Acidobacteriota bacterium]
MKKAIFLLFLLTFPAWGQVTDYAQWLKNEGYYLLTPEQKEKFRSLPDLDKELFIRDIWAPLDPDAITPENEFKIEYEKRFAYAKKHYGIPSDRAKIYLLLGKPNSVMSEANSDKYYPLELWSYYSLGHRNLPPSLELIFFKRWGTGEYRLYSPVFDGFKALTPSGTDLEDSRTRARLKAIFDPNIVQAAESLTTGASPMESEVIRTTLQDPSALRKILQKQRPAVETTIVYEGFRADVTAYSVPYEGPVFRTSIAIAVPPNYLAFEHDKDKDIYQGRVDLIGKIVDAHGKEIAKINDSPAIRMTQAEFEKSKSYYFSYLFDAYLLRGKYDLECLFRDYVSNAAGKVEKSFEVTAFHEDLAFAPLLVAYKSATVTEGQVPFGYNGQQYYPKENSSFSSGQNLIAYTTLMNPKKTSLEGIWNLEITLSQNGKNVVQANEQVPLSTSADVAFIRKMRLENLIPGEYILSLILAKD